ncbi:MAG: multi-sensor signal transduction histidine kinase [Chloroflexi bacterium OLB15]|nr:MAG: multi-sensor signal transduction histidine kinase [Chloroflexi bacterium OLB15]
MQATNGLTLLINGLTLALALSFLFILLWHDVRKEITQFFAVFLALVLLWNLGSFLAQAVILIGVEGSAARFPLIMLEFGFTGSSIALYALVASLVKMYSRRFRILLLAALVILFTYRVAIFAAGAPDPFVIDADGSLFLQTRTPLLLFYLLFDGAALYLLWRYQRKIRLRVLKFGLLLFIIGQSIGFLNPELDTFLISTVIGALATLVISVGILQQEIFRPLAERKSQVEAIRNVIASIASQNAVDSILEQLVRQSAELLEADGAAIFLLEDDGLSLKTTYELINDRLGSRLPLGEGVAGTAVQTGKLIQLDDYARDWKGSHEFAYASEFFGAVMCAPLVAGGDPVGALMVVASRHGRLFDREDAYLLQLLAAQAAVAIIQSRLFAGQTELNVQIEQSRNQLETVLVSTDSPVIAIDREFNLIFANPAAAALVGAQTVDPNAPIADLLPASAFPNNLRKALREIRKRRSFTYEAELGDKIYLCHVAGLGRPKMQGWVAVLNDITQLKELDRLKSEMVRMTSHDLKNPLQAAMANVDLLHEDIYETGSEDVRQSLDTIDRQLQRMNRIIRGILDLERLRDGALALELCAPVRIIEDAVHEIREFAREQSVVLDYVADDDLPLILCDVQQFERAIINLIENAIKFTPAGGSVKVAAERDNGEIVFSVSDTGVGIAAELHERIFDRFYRGKQRGVEHVSGSGLGLSLVKAIVINHRGRIALESEIGVGTRFTIYVPCA